MRCPKIETAVHEKTEKELTNKYKEQCMVGVTSVVYSEDEDVVGVKRQFHWNYDVIISDDASLKTILRDIVQNIE